MQEVTFTLPVELAAKFSPIDSELIKVYRLSDKSLIIDYDDSIPDEIIDAIEDQILDKIQPVDVLPPKQSSKVKAPPTKIGRKIKIPCRKYG